MVKNTLTVITDNFKTNVRVSISYYARVDSILNLLRQWRSAFMILTGFVKIKAEYMRLGVCHLMSWFFTRVYDEAFNPVLRNSRTPSFQHFKLLLNLPTHAIFRTHNRKLITVEN